MVALVGKADKAMDGALDTLSVYMKANEQTSKMVDKMMVFHPELEPQLRKIRLSLNVK